MNLKQPAGQKENKDLAEEAAGGLAIKDAQRGQLNTQAEPGRLCGEREGGSGRQEEALSSRPCWGGGRWCFWETCPWEMVCGGTGGLGQPGCPEGGSLTN